MSYRVYRIHVRRREAVALLGVVNPTTLRAATFAAVSVAASNKPGSELHDRTGLVRKFTRRQAGRLLPRLRAQEDARQAAVIADALRRRKGARRAS